MKRIYFKIEEMIDSIRNISEQLTKSNFDPEVIISINRGGCIPGIYLSHYINKPHEVINLELRDSNKEPDLISIYEKMKEFTSALIIDDINEPTVPAIVLFGLIFDNFLPPIILPKT